MKIKISELQANPFRDIENYPLMDVKINALEDAIKETGFWENIPVRKNGTGYQIHFGHHRLQALINVYGKDWEGEFSVQNVSDEVMHKRMIAENSEEWGATTRVIDENVKSAKVFLTNHLEIAAKYTENPEHWLKLFGKSKPAEIQQVVGRIIVLNYLKSINSSWTKTKVELSLSRLKMQNEGVDKEAMEMIEKSGPATNFAKAAITYNLTPEEQKEIAAEIVEEGNYGDGAIKAKIIDKKYPERKKKLTEEEVKRLEVLEFFVSISNTCDTLIDLIENMKKIAHSDFIIKQKEERAFIRMVMSLKALFDEMTELKGLEQ